MVFIPNGFKTGDKVELVSELHLIKGKFTIGHKFTITDHGPKGYDMIDDDGEIACEVPAFYFKSSN